MIQFACDPAKKTVELTVGPNAVTLTFTEKPWPLAAKDGAKVAGSASKGSAVQSLWNSIQRAAGLDAESEESAP